MNQFVLKTNTDLFVRLTACAQILVADLNKATVFGPSRPAPSFGQIGTHKIRDMQKIEVREIRTVEIIQQADERDESLLDRLP
jgi:hypothetical protein